MRNAFRIAQLPGVARMEVARNQSRASVEPSS
jgi:hypothetical protein